MRIRPAHPDEAAEISRLAIAPKAHWGYDDGAMEIFARELTLDPADLVARSAHVAGEAGSLLGFYTLAGRDVSSLDLGESSLELEHLYVRGDRLREGLGSLLLEHAGANARERGVSRLLIQVDPNAEGFYAKAGAEVIERIPTSIPGRTLPLMAIALPPDGPRLA